MVNPMFSKAYEIVSQFTRPVFFLKKIDGKTRYSGGTFIILNNEGWIITAAHLLDSMGTYDNDSQSCWWGMYNTKVVDSIKSEVNDLAIGRLEPFDPSSINNSYPKFKNPAKIKPGTSLCNYGYILTPFSIDENDEKNFEIKNFQSLVSSFSNEGICSKTAIEHIDDKGKRCKFLETSLPGVFGQSGGPIFDTKGTIWAIQSKTKCYPQRLCEPEVQNILVGWGVHPEVIIDFLYENNIKFNVSN